jgi:hypothetical protein
MYFLMYIPLTYTNISNTLTEYKTVAAFYKLYTAEIWLKIRLGHYKENKPPAFEYDMKNPEMRIKKTRKTLTLTPGKQRNKQRQPL